MKLAFFLLFLSAPLFGMKATPRDFMKIPALNTDEPTKIHQFEILDIDLNKALLAYHVIYNVFDEAGEVDEAGETNNTKPFVDCKFKNFQYPQGVEQWGILNLKTRKVEFTTITYEAVRNLKDCTQEKTSAKRMQEFKNKAKLLALNLEKKPPLSNDIPKDWAWEKTNLKDLRLWLKTRPLTEWNVIAYSSCNGGPFNLNDKNYDDVEMDAVLLKKGKIIQWIYPYCKNIGVMSSSFEYQLKGIFPDNTQFVALIDKLIKPGAHAYEHPGHFIGISTLLKID